jgi:hypothetical protein
MTPSGRLCSDAQTVQVVHVAAKDFRSRTGECLGASIRTAEPNHLMTCVDQLRNERRADETCSTRNKYPHYPVRGVV